jgi:streptogramin lyase
MVSTTTDVRENKSQTDLGRRYIRRPFSDPIRTKRSAKKRSTQGEEETMKILIATFAGLVLLFSLPASAQFNNPNGILFDSKGHLWLANSGDNNVLELSISGCTPTTLNTITTGVSSPTRLAFDSSGDLWVANLGNNSITVYDNLGAQGGNLIQTITNSAIGRPLGLAVDVYSDFYVADNSNNSVVAFNIDDQPVETLTQDKSGFPFLAPGVLVVHGQDIYGGFGPCSLETRSMSSCDNAVISYNVGEFLTDNPTEKTVYSYPNQTGPTGVAFDKKGNVYVSYYTTPSWVKYNSSGVFVKEVQNGVNGPEGIQVDSSGNVYVSNSDSNNITKYNSKGKLTCTIN